MNKFDEIFLQIYPVGSMFCSTQSTPPSMGEWELVREDVHERDSSKRGASIILSRLQQRA